MYGFDLDNYMPVYTCRKCEEDITTRSMSAGRLNEELWQHFFNFHSEDLDARKVFHTYLESDENSQSDGFDIGW